MNWQKRLSALHFGGCGTEIGRNSKNGNVKNAPERIISIDTSVYEEAGASSVQELAFALHCNYYLRQLLNSGDDRAGSTFLLQVSNLGFQISYGNSQSASSAFTLGGND